MAKHKIFNDPVYGFISVPYGTLFQLIEHPYFQRLRRIKQLGLTHYVYPGALHTRFHHALGALHLMTETIDVLRDKDVEISDEEAEAVSIAILLHDVGHGPFSHTLEHTLIDTHHESISVLFMEELNEQMGSKLDLAIQIFKDEYPKKFLHQLVSGQLDMDRMDYLTRDSFFTGVYEGVIGYDRIIKMLDVKEDELVVEEKGIYSIEKFLIARRLMYWQVYLHKTVVAAEQMLIRFLKRAKALAQEGVAMEASSSLTFFLENTFSDADFQANRSELLQAFARLDDMDIITLAKNSVTHEDALFAYLSQSLVNRRLFRLKLQNEPFEQEYVDFIKRKTLKKMPFKKEEIDYLVFSGQESSSTYSTSKDEIKILFKNKQVRPMSASLDYNLRSRIVTKYYLCHPKEIG